MIWARIVAVGVFALTLGPVLAVAIFGREVGALGPGDVSILRFTVWQAVLSALISVGLAIPVARALARRDFPGRRLLITLLGAPFLLPVIVAVLGLLAIFGRGGLISDVLALLGLPPLDIYGLPGILLAHVFLNLPLAVRLILQGWQRVPAERLRLAASLDARVWRLVEWPMLRQVVPGALAVVIIVCLSSFAVALTLGGGPRATTVELAIYQSMRFEFDLGRAAMLASLQAALGIGAAVVLWCLTPSLPGGAGGLDRRVERWDGTIWGDRLWIGAAMAFLLLPLGMVIVEGVLGFGDLPASVWPALGRSVMVACASTVICIALALPLAFGSGMVTSVAGLVPLSASALVVGTGLFILLRPFVPVSDLALPMTALVNGLLALPFGVRILVPAVAEANASFGRLADGLGLRGWDRWRIVVLPRLRAPLGFAVGLCAALSMGDLGVLTLFAVPDQETLPLLMYRLFGSYRTDAAAAAGLVLVAASFAVFVICDWSGRRGTAV